MDDGQQRYDSDCRTGLTDAQVKSRIDEGLTNAYNTNTTKSYKQIFKDNLVTFFNILNMVFTVLIVMTGYKMCIRDSLRGPCLRHH